MTIKKGDKITALNKTFEVDTILYADLAYEGEFDVEFLDPSGNYHHWKQFWDGGRIIPKDFS